ncbi:hypothetical protein OJF2_67650 [Aquisphaera giovannonii]|uniref:Prepilin-type N-terminal cleavage/methylation domain-containing protein n=1 Tax=Aquisphaera giovannonii TaxID=406548 RepID=A0A5B9WCB7_9BACT|nr:prepilin-type N-terminal cleavage/methylation domain-containing protein [Aquisphaera giovannonii]QEH38167.1 hypothetical protein OJF2_67650 [Aquisphaera giovannonii]
MRQRRHNPDARRAANARANRRGVTLIEMLVTLAVLLVMMTLVVRIFQAATGSLNAAQVYQEIDGQFRRLDSVIRSDLAGATAKMTPPNDPQNHTGYFEYIENEFADIQGEDCDDAIRMTVKAPAGRPFTGRVWLPPPNPSTLTAVEASNYFSSTASFQPITVTSDFAEVIYFLRNGNLYRRVLLVAPERQASIVPTLNNTATIMVGTPSTPATMPTSPPSPFLSSFMPTGLNSLQVSWQSMNDLSAHPAPRGTPYNGNVVILNTLSDLTDRENRWPNQRFADDFLNLSGVDAPDGLADDFNQDNVPDYYPTLYPTVISAPVNNTLVWEPVPYPRTHMPAMAFPFVFPGMYSRPQVWNTGGLNPGWIHSPEPLAGAALNQYDQAPLAYLNSINHAPIDIGDNLPVPITGATGGSSEYQTWWGFPTWRETLSPFWTDPTYPVQGVTSIGLAPGQPRGLAYQDASATVVSDSGNLLPAMNGNYRVIPQPFTDGMGTGVDGAGNGFFVSTNAATNTALSNLWNSGWEDDLVMTGVRSFDIKAYDNSLGTYADLGWGDDPRLTTTLVGGSTTAGGVTTPTPMGTTLFTPYLYGNYDAYNGAYAFPAYANVNGGFFDVVNQTFAHEGRMPPLVNDNRLDASNPNPTYVSPTSYTPAYPAVPTYSSNVGDDNVSIFRLRRTWDSWSTAYTKAPATGINPPRSPLPGFPAGPPFSPPIYPSYPAPYPAPLRGIQIQVRVTDPTSQRIKTLTIRQDFTDKL